MNQYSTLIKCKHTTLLDTVSIIFNKINCKCIYRNHWDIKWKSKEGLHNELSMKPYGVMRLQHFAFIFAIVENYPLKKKPIE